MICQRLKSVKPLKRTAKKKNLLVIAFSFRSNFLPIEEIQLEIFDFFFFWKIWTLKLFMIKSKMKKKIWKEITYTQFSLDQKWKNFLWNRSETSQQIRKPHTHLNMIIIDMFSIHELAISCSILDASNWIYIGKISSRYTQCERERISCACNSIRCDTSDWRRYEWTGIVYVAYGFIHSSPIGSVWNQQEENHHPHHFRSLFRIISPSTARWMLLLLKDSARKFSHS